ncbi:MAG: FecR family protein [Bacteroidota bacterium]
MSDRSNFTDFSLSGESSDDTSRQPVVTPEETEDALQNVRNRLGLSTTNEESISSEKVHLTRSSPSSLKSTRTRFDASNNRASNWLRGSLAIAASILIGIITAVWLQPTQLKAPEGDTLSVLLPDGSSVDLNGGSTLVYRRGFGDSHRMLELTGQAYFDVETSDLPFAVQTGSTVTRVTGTRFMLSHWPGSIGREVRLALFSGSVEFVPDQDTAEVHPISEGTGLLWRDDVASPQKYVDIDEARERVWERGGLSFQDTPLQTVLAAMETIYGISLQLGSPDLSSERVSLFYRNSPELESVLGDLAQVQGLRVRQTRNGYQLVNAQGQ